MIDGRCPFAFPTPIFLKEYRKPGQHYIASGSSCLKQNRSSPPKAGMWSLPPSRFCWMAAPLIPCHRTQWLRLIGVESNNIWKATGSMYLDDGNTLQCFVVGPTSICLMLKSVMNVEEIFCWYSVPVCSCTFSSWTCKLFILLIF